MSNLIKNSTKFIYGSIFNSFYIFYIEDLSHNKFKCIYSTQSPYSFDNSKFYHVPGIMTRHDNIISLDDYIDKINYKIIKEYNNIEEMLIDIPELILL